MTKITLTILSPVPERKKIALTDIITVDNKKLVATSKIYYVKAGCLEIREGFYSESAIKAKVNSFDYKLQCTVLKYYVFPCLLLETDSKNTAKDKTISELVSE